MISPIVIEEKSNGSFAVLRSPDIAEHAPDYEEVAHFPTRKEANSWRPA
jgi:hypothetical protein